jgi:hypothetical protein
MSALWNWFTGSRKHRRVEQTTGADPGDRKLGSSISSPPAGTVVREQLVHAVSRATDRDLLRSMPSAHLPDILGFVGCPEAKVAGAAARYLLQCPLITTLTVVLDHEQWPITVLANAANTSALERLLSAFAPSARRLVLVDIPAHLRWNTNHHELPDALALAVRKHLPGLEEVEWRVDRFEEHDNPVVVEIPLETFMPSNPKRLRKLYLMGAAGRLLPQWITWATAHEYKGPLQAFGADVSSVADMSALQAQWQSWKPERRPTTVEFGFNSPIRRGFLDIRDVWLKALPSMTPNLTRLRLHLDGLTMGEDESVNLVMHALAAADGMHTRLVELQMTTSTGSQQLRQEAITILGACHQLEILTLEGRFEVPDISFGDRPKSRTTLDGLDALVHVHLPVELIFMRSKPWPALASLHVDGHFPESGNWKEQMAVIPDSKESRPLLLDGTVYAATITGWREFLKAQPLHAKPLHATWRKMDLTIPARAVGEFSEWIGVNPFLEDVQVFVPEPDKKYVYDPATVLGDAFLAAWALEPIATAASPAEPTRPVRPLTQLRIHGSSADLVMRFSTPAISKWCTACPRLERISLVPDALFIQPDMVATLLRRLPRLMHLELHHIRANPNKDGWPATLDLAHTQCARSRLTVTLDFLLHESGHLEYQEFGPFIRRPQFRFDHT